MSGAPSGAAIAAIKGMNDVLPGAREGFLDSAVWAHIGRCAAATFESYGFAPVWLPVVEDTALFSRGLGTDTDIVSKEMYSFTDRGERALTLRPEGTAGAARAYVEHNLARTDPVQRWYYVGPMFRAERPQKGRYRQFYQVGAELFGVADVAADVEMLQMLQSFCGRLGLQGVQVRLNTLGDATSRTAWRQALLAYFAAHTARLCDSCAARVQANPLRVLDCKRPTCQDVARAAPDILDSLTPASRQSFERAMGLLAGLDIAVQRDPHLVRGLDYYTGIIFEFTTTALGAQDAILGGGRYDTLVAELGGPPTPGLGFAAGIERLALLLAQAAAVDRRGPHLYLACMDDAALQHALRLAPRLRADAGLRVEVDVSLGKLKAQLRRADRAAAGAALVLGSEELASGRGRLKWLADGRAVDVALDVAALAAALRPAAAPPR